MKKIVIAFMLLFGTAILGISAEEYVYNAKGQKVLLKDDYTWEFTESSQNTLFSFRRSKWGMNLSDVKGTELGTPKYDKEGLLVYSDKISGFNSDVVYIFIKNQLVRAKYLFKNEHSNKTDFIEDYKTIKNGLIKKYGASILDKNIWKNDLYKSDPDEWGMAIAVGHLQYYTLWETEDTKVLLFLDGDNYKISFGIEYASKIFSALEDQSEIENDNEKL